MDIWRQSGSDLVCQFCNVLPSVVQHVAHTEDGAERVFLRMVVTTLDLVPCHGGGEVPSEQISGEESRQTLAQCNYIWAVRQYKITTRAGTLLYSIRVFSTPKN